MINYETILSNFDDKVTLYNWLRKVEEALKNASLESVSVEQQSATTAILTFVFADGTSVISPTLTLPQGPQGIQGETGPQGIQGETGATGNGIASISLYSESGLTRTYRIMFTDGTHFDFDVTNGSSFVNVDGQDIAPRNVGATGNITAPSIIENMSGYIFYVSTLAGNQTLSISYAGAVKNGNKLTLALYATFNKGTTNDAWTYRMRFTIPAEVANKIVGKTIGGTGGFVERKKVPFYKSNVVFPAPVEIPMYLKKDGITSFYIWTDTFSPLDENTDYDFRYEITLLLSDSLISQ